MKHGIPGVHSFLRTCWFSLSGLHFYSNSALFVGFDFGFGISGNFKARSGITVVRPGQGRGPWFIARLAMSFLKTQTLRMCVQDLHSSCY